MSDKLTATADSVKGAEDLKSALVDVLADVSVKKRETIKDLLAATGCKDDALYSVVCDRRKLGLACEYRFATQRALDAFAGKVRP